MIYKKYILCISHFTLEIDYIIFIMRLQFRVSFGSRQILMQFFLFHFLFYYFGYQSLGRKFDVFFVDINIHI